MANIMVIGAHTRKHARLAQMAARQGHEVTQHYDTQSALASADGQNRFEVIHVRLGPDMDATHLLRLKSAYPRADVRVYGSASHLDAYSIILSQIGATATRI